LSFYELGSAGVGVDLPGGGRGVSGLVAAAGSARGSATAQSGDKKRAEPAATNLSAVTTNEPIHSRLSTLSSIERRRSTFGRFSSNDDRDAAKLCRKRGLF